jgi:uncharacterized protein (DUF362 family)
MMHPNKRGSSHAPRITRRRFLQLMAGGLAWVAAGRRKASAAGYRVGLGHLADPYAATRRAVGASREWPIAKIRGRKVVIKPNLVYPMPLEAGATTDPEVVRALVDLALAADAAQVCIVEGGVDGAHFSACGYEFFNSYDPQGRVALIDLSQEPVVLTRVPHGMAYHRIYMPELLLRDDVFFISAAKLKTHFHTHATLAMKNLVGLAPVQIYREPPDEWRWVMHYRGISQVIVDLNLVRPIDFAVVDGVIGMEGEGPVEGTPAELDLVVAGRNPVAVDRACLWATRLPQCGVKHLTYAARRGMGPADMDEIAVVGDPFIPQPFAWPASLPPLLEYPRVVPARSVPRGGWEVSLTYRVSHPCRTRVEIVRTSELSPKVTVLRTLHDLESRPPGIEVLKWDGRDDDGHMVPPGCYTVRVKANYEDDGTDTYGTGWVWAHPHPP